MATLPLVIDLSYGVHGNEISSPDAALLTAYHLLASRNDTLVAAVLAKVVVLIDPLQNPDGRDRFVHNFEASRGLEPDPNPASAEHTEPWPGGRTNHYLFDMNRDWLAAHAARDARPDQVPAMSGSRWCSWICTRWARIPPITSRPSAVPYNPHLTKSQKDSARGLRQEQRASGSTSSACATSRAKCMTSSTPATAQAGPGTTAASA